MQSIPEESQYRIFRGKKFTVVIAPNEKIYYISSIKENIKDKTGKVDWFSIELPNHVRIQKIILSENYTYFFVSNIFSLRPEIFYCNIIENLKDLIPRFKLNAIPLSLPPEVVINKIVFNQICAFAITECGNLYSWSELLPLSVEDPIPLGRIPLNVFDSIIPAKVDLPATFHCVDVRIRKDDRAFALSREYELCSWGRNQQQIPIIKDHNNYQLTPQLINLKNPKAIQSLEQLEFTFDSAYWMSPENGLFCLGKNLLHDHTQEGDAWAWVSFVPLFLNKRIKSIYPFEFSTFVITEDGNCYGMRDDTTSQGVLDNDVFWENRFTQNKPIELPDFNDAILEIFAVDDSPDHPGNVILFLTKRMLYFSGFTAKTAGKEFSFENVRQLYEFDKSADRLSSKPTPVLNSFNDFLVESYKCVRRNEHFNIVLKLSNLKETRLLYCKFPFDTRKKSLLVAYSLCWIAIPNDEILDKIYIFEHIWFTTLSRSVYKWTISKQSKFIKLSIDIPIKEIHSDGSRFYLTASNFWLDGFLVYRHKFYDCEIYDPHAMPFIKKIRFPLISPKQEQSEKPIDKDLIASCINFCECIFGYNNYTISDSDFDLLRPILEMANGRGVETSLINFEAIYKLISSLNVGKKTTLLYFEEIKKACLLSPSAITIMDRIVSNQNGLFTILHKPIILSIASLLDGYSLVSFSQTSRYFFNLLYALIINTLRFGQTHSWGYRLMQAPDHAVYFGVDLASSRSRFDHFNEWQKINAPLHLKNIEFRHSQKTCYLIGYNAKCDCHEVWSYAPTPKNIKDFKNVLEDCSPIGFPKKIKIKKFWSNNNCCMILTQEGTMYTWCPMMQRETVSLLGRVANIEEEYLSPSVIRIPDDETIVDFHVYSAERCWAISDQGHLYVWGNNQVLPRQIKIFAQKIVISFNAFTFSTNRAYLLDSVGDLVCIDHQNYNSALVHLPPDMGIRKIIARKNQTFALTEQGECFAWGLNENYCLGIPADCPEIIDIPTKIVNIQSPILNIICTEFVEPIDSLTIFIAKTGIYYAGLWKDSSYDNIDTPKLVPAFPKGAIIQKYSLLNNNARLTLGALTNFKNRMGVFYCSFSKSTNMEGRFEYTAKLLLRSDSDPIVDIYVEDSIYISTKSGWEYYLSLEDNNSLSCKPKLKENSLSKFALCSLSFFKQEETWETSRYHNEFVSLSGIVRSQETKLIKNHRFPLLWSSAIHANNLQDHEVINAARVFCEVYFVCISYRDPGQHYDAINPIMMVANGHVWAKSKIQFGKIQLSLPHDVVQGKTLRVLLENLRCICLGISMPSVKEAEAPCELTSASSANSGADVDEGEKTKDRQCLMM